MSESATREPLWRRLIGFNLLGGIVLGIVGFYFGWWLGHQIHADSLDFFADTNQNDVALMLGYLFAVIGFLDRPRLRPLPADAGCSAASAPTPKTRRAGVGRYFGLCTDHKVVGIQYMFGIGLFFFIAGLNAMLIRTELLRPSPQLFDAGNYLTLVGLHGTMMMGIMTSGVLGPFANYFVPLMIGARRMAFPRIEALTFWLLMAAGAILVTTLFFGGFPTGWTGYAPLNDQANYGFDSYIFFFALVGISMTLLGLNMIATIVTMRAPGLTWSRLPIFCWGALSTSILMVLAAPVLIAALLMVGFDRGRADLVLPLQRRRQPLPVPEPLLVLRPPGGVRPRPARDGDRARDPARLRAQAAVGLPARRRRAARGRCCSASSSGSTTSSSAASTRLAAALLHVLHRADLDPDRARSSSAGWRRCGGRASATRCRCCSAWPGSSTSSSAAPPASSSPTCRATSPPTAASSSWPTSTTRSWAGWSSPSSRRSTTGCRRCSAWS